MAKIEFIQPNGAALTVTACSGITLMEVAISHGIDGIEAVCGGAAACGTCQIYVAAPWLDLVGPPGEEESLLLDASGTRQSNSRLACQIRVSEELEGMQVAVAPRME